MCNPTAYWVRNPTLTHRLTKTLGRALIIAAGVCMAAGDDLVLLLVAPEPIALTYFTYVPHVEEAFEGYLPYLDISP